MMEIKEIEKQSVRKIIADWESIKGPKLQTDVLYLAKELLRAWEHIEFLQRQNLNEFKQ